MIIEFMLGMFIGYIVSRLSAISSGLGSKPIDKILMWDKTILGYRPVNKGHIAAPGEVFLFCYEATVSDKKVSSS